MVTVVRVRLFAALREAAGTAETQATAGRLDEILGELAARHGALFSARLATATVVLDGETVPRRPDVEVPEGAELALLPPVSGGADVADDWVARRAEVSVARALASATRAHIYQHLQEQDGGRSVREVAAAFELHPNVARTHLETLADAGLVVVGRRKQPAGGRPAKLYRARGDAAAVREEREEGTGLLVTLLSDLVQLAGAHRAESLAAMAAEVGRTEGRRLGMVSRPAPGDVPDGFEDRVTGALAALSRHVPGARLLRADDEEAGVVGPGGAFEVLEQQRPELGDALVRGLVAGFLAVHVGPVEIEEGERVLDGRRVWTVRRVTTAGARGGSAPAVVVDARGDRRDRGLVETIRATATLRAGDVLEVLADGPGSPATFARWADRAGHELIAVERTTDALDRPAVRLLIRVGS